MTDGEACELLALLPLRRGVRVVVRGLDLSASIAHGRVASIDGEGMATVTLLAGGGDVVCPVEDVRRACGNCEDCRTLHPRPRCADSD